MSDDIKGLKQPNTDNLPKTSTQVISQDDLNKGSYKPQSQATDSMPKPTERRSIVKRAIDFEMNLHIENLKQKYLFPYALDEDNIQKLKYQNIDLVTSTEFYIPQSKMLGKEDMFKELKLPITVIKLHSIALKK